MKSGVNEISAEHPDCETSGLACWPVISARPYFIKSKVADRDIVSDLCKL